jgi:type VI secretion system secreted protein VgrG
MALLGSDTSVTGPLPEGVLLLETLAGTEELGAPFSFELGLLSKDPNLDARAVLGEALAVGFKLGAGDWRYFHGIVTSFAKAGTTRLHTRYAAKLVPRLSLCDRTSDCRIFNDAEQDAVGIVTSVLADRGVTDLQAGALTDHALRKRELCAQYRESDLCFVQRLLEEEGIYYFFRHSEQAHTMVLADSIAAHESAAGYQVVPYTAEARSPMGGPEHLWGMKVRKRLFPGRHSVLAGYDASKPRPRRLPVGEARSGEPLPGTGFERYDHSGGLCEPDEAAREAGLRAQADRVDSTVIEVQGNTMGLGLGHLVRLLPSLDGGEEVSPFWKPVDAAKQYLVVFAQYSLSIDQYETGTVAGKDEPLKATYRLLDTQTPFRPRRTARKPRMGGPQTALVVGPEGEEIWTDKLGRVRVQFDWDRKGERNQNSTCWVRVAQPWAGGHWGAMYLPRIGQEVLVRFLDGDPDRPFVASALYNRDSMPPYPLPANRTQSGIQSRSSKGGTPETFNEIRFEDKKGAEELHLHAEKDMSTLVKDCQTLEVGVDRGVVVGNDEDNLVEQSRDLTVDKNDSVVIGGKHDKTVTGHVWQVYGGDHSRKVDGEQDLVEEQNKDEHVKRAYKLTTDKKFQLVQDTTSMTFKRTNVTLNAGGEVVVMAGGATISMETTGATTFDSPTGIKLLCGASSLAITPGGIAIATPSMTAAAGGGSMLAFGTDEVAMNGRQVHIEAAGVCSIKGSSRLKLQESEKSSGKQRRQGGAAGTGEAAASAKEGKGKEVQAGAQPDSPTLEIHVVDLNGKPQVVLAFEIKKPDGGTETGKLDQDGRGWARSSKPGVFEVRFPDLDGADWDGDGAMDPPPEPTRRHARRHKVEKGDRVPTIARKNGFARWQTIWDFACNLVLKEGRASPNALSLGDEVSIPTKLDRVALVSGGLAEFVVSDEGDGWVFDLCVRLDIDPNCGCWRPPLSTWTGAGNRRPRCSSGGTHPFLSISRLTRPKSASGRRIGHTLRRRC